jgi:chemotaxis protein CheD
MLRELLWKNGVMIDSQDVGGTVSRSVSIDVADGEVTLSSQGKKVQL